ncbi:ribose ABC transport system [Klebsiella pneumoniae]|uniref:Ribose ABC transport system n=1 Tax=Klebsiella pneumoniae TaxID=573 RepID=A0A377WAC0_KLEPN|nr:ribose ABC transport system [Klebsiella pneumoniae]
MDHGDCLPGGLVHAAPYSPGPLYYALGGNEAATRLSGISVNKVKIIVYALCGMLASLAGIIEVARLSSAQPTAGTGYELDAIAAVVLGAPASLVAKDALSAR